MGIPQTTLEALPILKQSIPQAPFPDDAYKVSETWITDRLERIFSFENEEKRVRQLKSEEFDFSHAYSPRELSRRYREEHFRNIPAPQLKEQVRRELERVLNPPPHHVVYYSVRQNLIKVWVQKAE